LLTIAETGGINRYPVHRTDRGFAIIRPQDRFGMGWQGRQMMKKLMIAAALLALVAMPAHAQRKGGVQPGSSDPPRKPLDEKAYNAALDRIPEPKQKYDPWGVARPADATKKTK
jgi:hypothetical protein